MQESSTPPKGNLAKWFAAFAIGIGISLGTCAAGGTFAPVGNSGFRVTRLELAGAFLFVVCGLGLAITALIALIRMFDKPRW